MIDSSKPACLICHTETGKLYNPPHRPASCECRYDVHRKCYETWIVSSGAKYHCLICRKVIFDTPRLPVIRYEIIPFYEGEIHMRGGYLIPIFEIPDMQIRPNRQPICFTYVWAVTVASILVIIYLLR